MSPLPVRSPESSTVIHVEQLTPITFAPFGTVIVSPVDQDVIKIPAGVSYTKQQAHQPRPQPANQNTALKTSPVSPLINNYPMTNATSGSDAKSLMSIFSCFPRENVYLDKHGKLKLKIEILERHPYTTQTFCPFNHSDSKDKTIGGRTFFLVVVAPTMRDANANPSNPPDLSKVRAFLAPIVADGSPGMAVTYNPGTWHAPMVVLGERRIDFLVTQFANGRAEDDCQEVLIGDARSVVEVDLGQLGLEDAYLWRKAKL